MARPAGQRATERTEARAAQVASYQRFAPGSRGTWHGRPTPWPPYARPGRAQLHRPEDRQAGECGRVTAPAGVEERGCRMILITSPTPGSNATLLASAAQALREGLEVASAVNARTALEAHLRSLCIAHDCLPHGDRAGASQYLSRLYQRRHPDTIDTPRVETGDRRRQPGVLRGSGCLA